MQTAMKGNTHRKAVLFLAIFIFFIAFLHSLPLFAAENVPPEAGKQVSSAADKKEDRTFPDFIFSLPESEQAAMDIHPSRFADFWKKWHFVGARWRQDVREFRYAYANDLAWKTLSEQRTDYPVGAMFGKLVFPAEEDLALPSSVMPSNLLNRMLVMLWDPKHKKAGADGWVYIRFINPDPRIPQDKDSTGLWGVMSQKEIKSCVECHARAYDRGYVFSQPSTLFREGPQKEEVKDKKILSIRFAEAMKDMGPKDIPRIVNNLILSVEEWKNRKVKGYAGDFFSGALGEIGPVMARMAQENKDTIYLVFDRDDPNTLQIASSITKKGHENCAGLVRMRGSGIEEVNEALAEERQRKKAATKGTAGTEAAAAADIDHDAVKTEAQGVRVRDLTKQYKPTATLYIMCGAEGISRQALPLLYKVKDNDGLPSYYFAPAIID